MERARIITLGNATPMTATSFEEAFGDYSEARGRGRARRQKRKMERITNRKTRRTARQQGRLEKKKSRVEARTQRRTMRADNREQRRAQKSEGKRSRERADLEMEREFAPEPEPQEAPQSDSGYAPQGGGYDDGGYAAPQSDSGYAPQGGGYDDGGYAAPQGGGYDYAPQDEGGYAEEGGYDEGGYAEEGGYDEGGYDEGGYDESDGFDGESYDFDGADEMIDAPYSPQVNQNVMDAAKRIEWNLEMASRLNEKGNSPKVKDAVFQCENRVAELKSTLDGYCNFEGEFESDASGKMRYRKRKGLNNQEKRRRNKEMRNARMMARKERNAMRKKNGLTPVMASLNPEIGNNSIVIPAKELGSNATGIIGLDDAGDYDASATEIKLGVDGAKTSKIPFKAIAIGLVVGGVAMFLLKKYKVI